MPNDSSQESEPVQTRKRDLKANYKRKNQIKDNLTSSEKEYESSQSNTYKPE